MSLAARATDPHVCPAHGGGPILPPPEGRVRTNRRAPARASDRVECLGTVDFIVTGSGTVKINSMPAARMADKTMHQGAITLGSGNVAIGGPTVGVTLGNADAGKKACVAAAAGREPPPGSIYPPTHPRAGKQIGGHTTMQSYNNCGIESCRIIINQATGKKVGEDELLDWAIDHNDAVGSKAPRKRFDSGGTMEAQRQDILRAHGVESSLEPQTMENITQAVAEGKGVITAHDPGVLWDNKDASGGHAIVVTGITYGANGQIVGVVTLDTGRGACASMIPADRFQRSLRPSPKQAVITKKAIW